MCFRIINHKKSHITKGKGYICSNLKITDNEEISLLSNKKGQFDL